VLGVIEVVVEVVVLVVVVVVAEERAGGDGDMRYWKEAKQATDC
jgi:hypothetical protein